MVVVVLIVLQLEELVHLVKDMMVVLVQTRLHTTLVVVVVVPEVMEAVIVVGVLVDLVLYVIY